MAGPGLAVLAIALTGFALIPAEPTSKEIAGTGMRTESESFTGPTRLAQCITYNINKKMPDLQVRSRASDIAEDGIFLILATIKPESATFGVIRIDERESGSHLTTWLPQKSTSVATADIAVKLVAGC